MAELVGEDLVVEQPDAVGDGGLAGLAARRDLAGGGQSLAELVPESATYALGLGTRWLIASFVAAPRAPSAAPWAMVVAEICGYAVWGVLSILPIYPDRPLLPLADREGLRGAIADMRLIFPLALMPFVYLIAYGYETAGLIGAGGGWRRSGCTSCCGASMTGV